MHYYVLVKKSHYSPEQALRAPGGSGSHSLHIQVIKLSALLTGRLYPPGNIPGTHFCWYSDWLRAGRSGDRIPVEGEIFRTYPDRPWGPPSLLYNGYRVFPRGKERPGRDSDPSPPSSAVVMKE